MGSIMGQTKPEYRELFALEFGNISESDFVYTLASTNINQSAPNSVKTCVTIRFWMSSIIDLIGPEMSELFALQFAKVAESDLIFTLASTNVDQLVPNMVTIYEILDEFDDGLNPTRSSRVICPLIGKIVGLFYTPSSTNNNQSAPNVVKLYATVRS